MSFLLHLLFPQQCVVCGKVGSWLCTGCKNKLPRLRVQLCPVCNSQSIIGLTHPGCQKTNALSGFFSPFAYQGAVKKLLSAFKFEMVKELQAVITGLLTEEVKKNVSLLFFWQKEKFILTPLPLHPYRERWRGFNQSLLVGKSLAKSLNLGYRSDFLKRIDFAPPQVGLDKKERLKNIKNQFRASLKVKNKNIVIFDDVWTTGATLKEAGRVLKSNGVKNVWGLTFCR